MRSAQSQISQRVGGVSPLASWGGERVDWQIERGVLPATGKRTGRGCEIGGIVKSVPAVTLDRSAVTHLERKKKTSQITRIQNAGTLFRPSTAHSRREARSLWNRRCRWAMADTGSAFPQNTVIYVCKDR